MIQSAKFQQDCRFLVRTFQTQPQKIPIEFQKRILWVPLGFWEFLYCTLTYLRLSKALWLFLRLPKAPWGSLIWGYWDILRLPEAPWKPLEAPWGSLKALWGSFWGFLRLQEVHWGSLRLFENIWGFLWRPLLLPEAPANYCIQKRIKAQILSS